MPYIVVIVLLLFKSTSSFPADDFIPYSQPDKINFIWTDNRIYLGGQ